MSSSTFTSPWLLSAISSLHLAVPLQVAQRQPLLQDVEIKSIAIHFAHTRRARRREVSRSSAHLSSAAIRGKSWSVRAPEGGRLAGDQQPLLDVVMRARLVLPFSVKMDIKRADLRLVVSGAGIGEVGYLNVWQAGVECDAEGDFVNITLKGRGMPLCECGVFSVAR